MNPTSFYEWKTTNLHLNVLATAWAKQDAFWKVVWDRVKVMVKKAPENGQATEYMRKFIAASFSVTLKNVELLYGETSPNKAFLIKNPLVIPEKLKSYIELP